MSNCILPGESVSFTNFTCVMDFRAENINEDPEDGDFLILRSDSGGNSAHHIAVSTSRLQRGQFA